MMLHDVASEVAEMEAARVDLETKETTKAYTVWMNGHHGQKVATVAKNGGTVEFPVSDTVVAVAAALVPQLEFKLTYNDRQVCLNRITTVNLPEVEAGLRAVMAAAVRDHPSFNA
jgi:phage replication-related protein YjqB (UPF0714/DUF867 family)